MRQGEEMFRAIIEAGFQCHSEQGLGHRYVWRALYSTKAFSYSRPSRRPAADRSQKGSGASIRQERLASEVRAVVSTALQQGLCNGPLLQRCGFELQKVNMSGDLRKAFVVWKSMPGMQKTVEKELNAHGTRLRSMVFERLSMPFSPAIEFCEDKPNLHARAVEEALAKLEKDD